MLGMLLPSNFTNHYLSDEIVSKLSLPPRPFSTKRLVKLLSQLPNQCVQPGLYLIFRVVIKHTLNILISRYMHPFLTPLKLQRLQLCLCADDNSAGLKITPSGHDTRAGLALTPPLISPLSRLPALTIIQPRGAYSVSPVTSHRSIKPNLSKNHSHLSPQPYISEPAPAPWF